MESAMVGNQLQAYMKKSGINPIKVGFKLFREINEKLENIISLSLVSFKKMTRP